MIKGYSYKGNFEYDVIQGIGLENKMVYTNTKETFIMVRGRVMGK